MGFIVVFLKYEKNFMKMDADGNKETKTRKVDRPFGER